MKKQHRFTTKWFIFLLVLAGLGDLVSLIPTIGDLVAPIYFGFFSWYLYKTGHGIFNWKLFVTDGISFVAEMIPVVQELPMMMVATILVFTISRFEDKTGLSTAELAKGKVRRIKRPPPLNQDGVRAPRKNPDNIVEADFSTGGQDLDMAA